MEYVLQTKKGGEGGAEGGEGVHCTTIRSVLDQAISSHMVTGGAAKKKSGNRTSIKDFFGKFGKCVSTSVSARTRNPSQKQGGALNKRLVGPTDGRTYERISRDSLNYYYGGTQYHNAAVVMDMIMNCLYMDGYKMPGDWFDKNLVNIVFIRRM